MSSEQKTNIKFVKAVEKHPCLYNFRHKEYGRRDAIEKAWNNVGKAFNLTPSQSKEKWKNLRTVLCRKLKPLPSGSLKRVRKRYYLADAMKFTIPFIKTQALTTRLSVQDPLDNTAESTSDIANDKDDPESNNPMNSPQQSSTMSTPSLPPSPQPCSLSAQSLQAFSILPTSPQSNSVKSNDVSESNKKREKSTDLTEVDENILEYLKSRNEIIGYTDPTKISKKMFLLSLLPDLYSMDNAQTRTFKIKVLTLIDEILRTPNSSQPVVKVVQPSSSARHSFSMSPTQQLKEEIDIDM